MPLRLWQRQPGESPADFTAFAANLRLKGCRSHRATARLIGRSLGSSAGCRSNLSSPITIAYERDLSAV